MRALLLAFAALFLHGEIDAQPVRGMSERQVNARKPDLTQGGGNSSVGATRPVLPDDRKARFEALDLDADGRVSLAEAAGHAEVVTGFERADRNRDGKLTLAEFSNLGRKPAKKAEPPRRPKATARTARPGASTSGTSSASTR